MSACFKFSCRAVWIQPQSCLRWKSGSRAVSVCPALRALSSITSYLNIIPTKILLAITLNAQ